MARVTDAEAQDAHLAALRQDPAVVIHRRTTTEPYTPRIRVTEQVDIVKLLGRDDEDEPEQPPA